MPAKPSESLQKRAMVEAMALFLLGLLFLFFELMMPVLLLLPAGFMPTSTSRHQTASNTVRKTSKLVNDDLGMISELFTMEVT